MKKILIIDDAQLQTRTVESFLKDQPYELFKANSGEEGISLVLDHNIDLIFLDIEMPRLDGYDVVTLIKGNEAYKHIPLVMVSSKDTLFDRYKGLTYGADDYIAKPYQKNELLRIINKFLGEI